MKKFVILDPSIKKQGGHYLEYANRVLDAAQRQGFDTLIVGNKAFVADSNLSNHPVLAWFHRDFFEYAPTFEQYAKSQLGEVKRTIGSLRWGVFNALVLNNIFIWFALGLFKRCASSVLSPSRITFFQKLWASVKRNKVIRLAGKAIRILGKAVRILGKAVRILGKAIAVLIGLPVGAVIFMLYVWQLAKKPDFGSDLKRLLSKGIVQPGDLIFIPTAGLVELNALKLVIKKVPLALKIHWRILFRRDLIDGRRVSELDSHEKQLALDPWRKILASIRQHGFHADIAFFTDTKELTDDYNALGVYSAKTTAIPVDPELYSHVSSLVPAMPLTVLYMGDARDEKGFHLLPPLINRTIDLIKAKRICYACQSNFNVPQGEKESSRALARLRAGQEETGVKLIPGPLTTEEYRSLIQSAGVVVLPYMQKNYLSRSSGVFAEALAAGIPCLVPAGTSMARLAEQFRQKHFKQLSETSSFHVLTTFEVAPDELLSGCEFISSNVCPTTRKKAALTEKCVKLSFPLVFSRDIFVSVQIENYDDTKVFLNKVTQTVALEKGVPSCALLNLTGDIHRLTISFSPTPKGHLSGLPIEICLLESETPWSRGAGVNIYEDSEDLEISLRNLIEFYEYNRQIMTEISAETWPLFNPECLVRQLSEVIEPDSTTGGSSRPKIMFWSDLSIGYGSPQIPSLAESMRQHYQAEVCFLALDQIYRPVVHPDFLSDEIIVDHVFTAHYPGWGVFPLFKHIAYGSQALGMLEKFKPDILVVTDVSTLLYLKNAKYKPKVIILYLLEQNYRFQQTIAKSLAHLIDYVIYPEKNRALLELPRLGLDKGTAVPFLMHNSRKFKRPPSPVSASERNGRFIYAGGLWYKTNVLWFLENEIQKFPIDIFGEGHLSERFKNSKTPKFYGYLPSDSNFFHLLGQYAFSLILWSPEYEDTYYCAPNKLYDALACGVPFISGPHPLCLEVAAKYKCGLIMSEWSVESFAETLEKANQIFGTSAYQEMVDGCRKAMDEEYNWDLQFSKLAAVLPTKAELRDKL